jgi:trk system potassium uptake protein TrkA
MKKAIDGGKEDMKSILLIGLGRFGRHIAIKLDELNHQVMAVDNNESRVEAVLPYVRNAQIGDATNEDFIRSLGVRNFDVCIVAIGDNFQSSLETTSLLKELGAKMVVSRAARDVHAKFLLRNGADEVVYPEKQLASWTAIRYSADHIFDYVELDEEHGIFEISIPDAWIGKTVGELDIRRKYDINILAIKNNGELSMAISPDTFFTGNISLLVIGEHKAIKKCFHI